MLQEFVQQIKNTVSEVTSGMHTALPATIDSIDRDTGLAVVIPSMKYRMTDGTKLDYPKITGVPIVFPQGNAQAASITYPVKEGDSCLLIIAEESLEYWLYGMETDTTLPFDITNAICIPGLFPSPANTLFDSIDADAVIITSGSTKVSIKDGEVSIKAESIKAVGSLTVSGNLSVSGSLSGPGFAALSE